MPSSYFNKVSILALICFAAASGLSVLSVYHAIGYLHRFSIWVAAPYVLLMLLSILPLVDRRRRDVASVVTAAVLLVVTYQMYVADLWSSTSATGTIIYLYGPVYVLVGGIMLWLLTFFLVRGGRTTDA